VKRLFKIRKRIAGALGFDVLAVTQQGVKLKDTTSGEGQLALDYSKYQIVETGDFAMNHMDLLTGFIDISAYNGVTSPDYRVFVPQTSVRIHKRFYLYVFQLCYLARIFYPLGQGSSQFGRWRLPREAFEGFEIPNPPPPTQKAIADFLDRKTATIDALIEKKKKLLDLLAEKRAALINQAVTTGLNPNLPMKDSGVPWIGEIPAHWQTRKLRYIAAKLQGRIIVQPHLYFADEGVPIVFGYNIKDGQIDESGLSKVSFEADRAHSHARAQAGDLYTVRLGSPGMTAVVPDSLDGCHFASIMWVHQHERANSGWLCHAMNSAVVQAQINAANYGATLRQFNIADAVDWVLPFPPKAEQIAIAAFLDARLDRFLSSSRAVTEQIERLREYRQAVITAAVTGQLDVGEEVA